MKRTDKIIRYDFILIFLSVSGFVLGKNNKYFY